MNFDLIKSIKYENKAFLLFLLVHLIVWSTIALMRTVMPTDTLEGIYWGSLMDFGTPKHPPLAAWLTYLAYMPLKIDFCVYLFSQLFIITGFVYIYKLAKFFLDENKAILSVIVLEGCWCYSYVTSYYGFNPDVVLLMTLPAIAYYFYKTMKDDKLSDWIILALFLGFSFLNKYQTVFLLLFMFIWAVCFKREVFKNWKFYLSVILAFLIFLPHILWLFHYDFFPLLYFDEELTSTVWWNHLTAPLLFLVIQLAAIYGTFVIFSALMLKSKSSFKFENKYNMQDFWFLLLLGLGPLTLHFIMGLFFGGTMRPRWGFEFLFMAGILLFAFIPNKIERKEFNFTLKMAYIVMAVVFVSLASLYSIEKNFRSRYPVKVVSQDLKNIWKNNFKTPLKYIGGYIEYTLPLTIYDETHPINILDTHGYKSPWIDEEDLRKSGALIIDRHPYGVLYYAVKTVPTLKDYKIIKPKTYKFTVYNMFKQPREYTVYYALIPPQKK